MNVSVVIPAYNPPPEFPALIEDLSRRGFGAILVVNDGSAPSHDEAFTRIAALPGVRVLRHAVNLGKGAALKTGLNFALAEFPGHLGVVTADADLQHAASDIEAVGRRLTEHPGTLVLGVRQFDASRVPFRSRFGNAVTARVLRLVTGQRISDTQTGLRAIPRAFALKLLTLPSAGYEFEIDMLLMARHARVAIAEVPIRTIYSDGNRTSHFSPLWDSMRIYFVLLRFTTTSVATAALDNVVFAMALGAGAGLAGSQIAGRAVAALFNYSANKRFTFASDQTHARVFPRYMAVVALSGACSYALILLLESTLRLAALPAKLMAETLLFVANFVVQRDLVFTRRAEPGATDWDAYYRGAFFASRFTRRVTVRALLGALRHATGPAHRVVEFGGANSCFLDDVRAATGCREYHVVDTNRYGLDLLRDRDVILHQHDVLAPPPPLGADLAFSVGLVEHFPPELTRRAIASHFAVLAPGGLAVISFPTPTWLYRLIRGAAELLGLWKFPDERALARDEVASAIAEHADILHEKTVWPIGLTQHLIAARKR